MKTIHVCIIGTFLLLHAAAEVKVKETRNAEDATFRVMKSPDGKAYFPEGKESYYTRYYRAAMLPSMQHEREEKGNVRFRLAILPSFSKPLFLTYSRGAAGAYIEITRLQPRFVGDDMEPGDVDLSGKVALGNRIAKRLEADAVEPEIRTTYRELTKEQREIYNAGLDGSTWILEVSTDKDYTMEDIWSPGCIANSESEFLEKNNIPKVDAGAFMKFCESLLDYADMKLPEQRVSILLDNG